jgi:6-phosphogluconolactonase
MKLTREYGSGSAIHIPLLANGHFSKDPTTSALTVHLPPASMEMKHPRQDAPHAHQIVFHGDKIFIPDLGTNSVVRQYPPKAGKQWQSSVTVWGFQAGDGPRHVAIHPKGEFV